MKLYIPCVVENKEEIFPLLKFNNHSNKSFSYYKAFYTSIKPIEPSAWNENINILLATCI